MLAALGITDRYCAQIEKQGYRVTSATTDEQPVHDAAGLARYLTSLWSPDDAHKPFGLLQAALNGDEVARQAFEELAEVLFRRPIVRGSGVLGAGSGE